VITFATAGPDTRTTQLFINYQDNTGLDASGFSGVGVVVEGLETAVAVQNPTPGNSDGVDQDLYSTNGNDWIKANYPNINFITKTTLVASCPIPEPSVAVREQ